MIHIVTDSTATLTPSMADELGVAVVPLRVIFGQESYRDAVDMTNAEFYARLRSVADLPTTSQPAVGDFHDVYSRLTANGDKVVSIHLSSKLSGTVNAAKQAAGEFAPGQVTVVDTNWISSALYFQVREAVRAQQAGQDVDGIIAAVQALDPKLHLYLVVDSLVNLRRSGRLSPTKAFIGGLLNVKPILAVRDAVIEPVESPRSKKTAIRRMLELVSADVKPDDRLHVALLHAQATAELDELSRQVHDRFNVVEAINAEVGPTIGTHVGVGTLGIVYYTE